MGWAHEAQQQEEDQKQARRFHRVLLFVVRGMRKDPGRFDCITREGPGLLQGTCIQGAGGGVFRLEQQNTGDCPLCFVKCQKDNKDSQTPCFPGSGQSSGYGIGFEGGRMVPCAR